MRKRQRCRSGHPCLFLYSDKNAPQGLNRGETEDITCSDSTAGGNDSFLIYRKGVEMEEQIRQQAEFAVNLTYEDIPEEVRERARCVILDSLGCIYKGLGESRIAPEDREKEILDRTLAMVSTELYEGNRKAIGHPACHILPLMFGQEGQTLGTFIKNFVAAYEVASRWGAAIRFTHDILGHGTVMTSGATVAEGLYLGVDSDTLYEALLLTGSLPEVSVWQSVWDGSRLHDAYAGLSACKAKKAYELLPQGVRSSGRIIQSVYRDIMGATIEPDKFSEGLGNEFLLMSNYYKIHTGCRFVHPFADVIQQELSKGLDKESIGSISIYTYKKAARLTAQQVPNKLAGQFSIPVSIAVLLEKGELSPDTITACVEDPGVLSWEGRITLYEDEAYNKLLPDTRGGRVELHFKDGKTRKIEVFHARGDFDNPDAFTKEDVVRKFENNVAGILSKDQIARLEKMILSGEEDTPFILKGPG